MSYQFEKLTDANFHLLVNLFHACYGVEIDTGYLKRKFGDQSGNHEGFPGFLAIDESSGNAVASFGVCPTLFSLNGQPKWAAQCIHAMTDTNHRKKGLFRQLHALVYEWCSKNNIAFMFAFPNPNSFPGFKSFGWSHIYCKAYSWILPLSLPEKVLRRIGRESYYTRKSRLIAAVGKTHFSGFGPEFSFFAQGPFHITRDEKYLLYKQSLGSKLIGLPSGDAWIKYGINWIEIGDIFSPKPNKVLEELLHLCRQAGIELVRLVLSSGQKPDELLRVQQPTNLNDEYMPFAWLKTDPDFSEDVSSLAFTGGDFDTF